MNTASSVERRLGLRMAAGLGAVVLFVAGCASNTGPSAKSAPSTSKVMASRATSAGQVREVYVTGSNIPVRVKGTPRKGDLPVNLTVVDTESAMNQGYPTPLDMLLHNPAVSQGYRGR